MARADKNDDMLAKLREKLEQEDLGKRGGSRSAWFNTEEGDNVIRIMPPVGNMEVFYTAVGIHYMPDNSRIYCPFIISDGEEKCPVCELQDQLWRSGNKELASKIKVSKTWWMNVIDRKNEKDGPKIYSAPATVFAAIRAAIFDPDYGDITDEYDGVDFVINKTKTGPQNRDVEYQGLPRRISTPLAGTKDKPDEEQMDEWFDAATDLSVGKLTMNPEEDGAILSEFGVCYAPYERIAAELVEGLGDDAGEAVQPEPIQEASSVVANVRTRRARSRRAN